MDHATGAMGSLLLKLGDLIVGEYKLQTGVKEDVEYMKRELTSMYIALRKVGDIPRDQLDLQVKSWADEVRDLSYMMEDNIDKFLVRVEGAEPAVKPRKLKRLMEKMGDLFTKSKTRHEISEEIKGIKARVQEAADRRDRYKVNDVVANPSAAIIADPRLLSLYKDKKDLVGIDGPLNELTNMLLSDGHGDVEKQLKVVSIFGFGGLGKTTLAKALFDKLQPPFDCSAFVPVGRNPSAKKLLNNILFEINKNTYPELDERQLIDKLQVLLKNKRYFIVIDDIWDTEAWEIFKCALVNNCCGSRIITTTRILDVAEKTGEVYRIKSLSNDLSKELFHRRLSGGNRKNPSDLPAKVLNLGWSNTQKLPQSIGLLNQLKCLKADHACITVEQDWIGKLTSLEELWVYNVDSSSNFATELGKLTELRRLQIGSSLDLHSVSLVKAWAMSLVKLQKIQVIDVDYIFLRDTGDVTLEGYVPPQQLRVFNLSYRQPGLYASIKSSWLPNLSHLSLHVDSPDVEIFGRFSGLVYLSLHKDRPVQGHHVMGGVGVGLFPKLRVYRTSATPGPFLPGAMPSLESLKFWVDVWTSRDGNIEFDFGSLLNLPMLQKVTISMWSGKSIKDEDWQKAVETVRHGVDSHPNHPTLDLNELLRGLLEYLNDPDAYGV